MSDEIAKCADVVLSCGRFFLRVFGLHIAMQGDPCRDPLFRSSRWDELELREAAERIRAEIEKRERAAFEAAREHLREDGPLYKDFDDYIKEGA